MLFAYEAIDSQGKAQNGSINAASEDMAIVALQRRGFTVMSVKEKHEGGSFSFKLSFIGGVSNRDIVLLSRQIATLFEAQVSALRVFQLLAEQAEKPYVREVLTQIADDIQAGSNLSQALAKHPKVFSDFYVHMVQAGEESGKLDETFLFLADYLDRSFELTSKARNALVYPAFVLVAFLIVMILMLTIIIPKLTTIIADSGGSVPFYTQIIINLSQFLRDYGVFLLVFLIIGGFLLFRWTRTASGKLAFDRFKLDIPYVGALYRKLYMSRIADNLHVMLSSGIAAVRALEITSSVVDNHVYQSILNDAVESVKAGNTMSGALDKYPDEIPKILVQMIQIGEETGELGNILNRLAKFYQREVNMAVDSLVNLIEPALIIMLAVGVGFLLTAILVPIYNVASSI